MTNTMLRSGLFGDLFRDPQVELEFGASALLLRMVQFERAWTEALRDTGELDSADAAQALVALDRFEAADFTARSDTDGLPVPALIAHICATGYTPTRHGAFTAARPVRM